MIAIIQPSKLAGIIQAPASKSSMQRACAAALLQKGTSIIKNPGYSNDDKVALKIIEVLGAKVVIKDGQIIVDSHGIYPVKNEVNCGESGLGIRMFTPIIALSDQEITITGEGSLLNRPMNFFDKFFRKLGVSIQSNDGKLPLKIRGPLQSKNVEVDGSMSSQFITGLLMAYGAANANGVSIKVKDLKSKPYIDLTLDVMKQFDMNVPENKNYEEFYFLQNIHDSQMMTHEYSVEADWSGGAFLLVAGAIAGAITIRGLDLTSTQADKAIIDVLMSANAAISMEAKGIKIRPAQMKAFEFDATDCPDLFPPLVALAAFCNGTSLIKGVNRLMYKESNRAIALQEEFGKMGVKIELENDVMIIYGNKKMKGAKVHSHHDHRIAMACAVAALKADSETEIEAAEAINKSYPDFFWHLKKLGADVSLPNRRFIV